MQCGLVIDYDNEDWDSYTCVEVTYKIFASPMIYLARQGEGDGTVEITEVRIKLMEDPDDRLQAFCSITIDDWFVVRDLKIIDGTSGPFVAMPSRKLTTHCRRCRCKNHLKANYCNQCGAKTQNEGPGRDPSGRVKLYADIAHPINSECREAIQDHVITEFEAELERASQPDYTTRYDDAYGDYNPVIGEPESSKPGRSTPDAKRRIERGQPPSGPHTTDSLSTAAPEKKTKNSNQGTGSFGDGIFD